MRSQVEKSLVIGFATNQAPEKVLAFCKSIRSVYGQEECDVVLGVNQFQIIDICRSYNILAIPTVSRYQKGQTQIERFLKKAMVSLLSPIRHVKKGSAAVSSVPGLFLEATLHPHLGRWFFYKRVLDVMPTPKKILITDVSDVFFQRKFFDEVHDDSLHLFCESGSYGESDWNDKTYTKLYGEREFNKIIGQPVVCMGVLGGGSLPVHALINWIIESVYGRPNGGSDQVRGNRYVHLNKENETIKVFRNADGGVLHINKEKLIGSEEMSIAEVRAGCVIERKTGKLIPIVHMYNRNTDVLSAVMGSVA